MANRKKRKSGRQCCPAIRAKCRLPATRPGRAAPREKICIVRVGSSPGRRMSLAKAARFIGQLVRAQTRGRCSPLVNGAAAVIVGGEVLLGRPKGTRAA